MQGLTYTSGIYYVAMLQQFRHGHSYTALMGSLMNAFFFLGGKHIEKGRKIEGLTYVCALYVHYSNLLLTLSHTVSVFITSVIRS